MEQIVYYVENDPGRVLLHYVDMYTTSNGHSSRRYGYQAANRAAKRGLIKLEPNPNRKYSWVVFPSTHDN